MTGIWMTNPIPTDFILELLDLVLKYNIFEFDGKLYQQLVSMGMGTRAAPNIFMSFIDEDIIRRAQRYFVNGVSPLAAYKRFLDDIFIYKAVVNQSRTKRHRDSAVPYLQELLNKDHFKRRKELKSLLDAGRSQSYKQRQRIKPKNWVNYVSNIDVIT